MTMTMRISAAVLCLLLLRASGYAEELKAHQFDPKPQRASLTALLKDVESAIGWPISVPKELAPKRVSLGAHVTSGWLALDAVATALELGIQIEKDTITLRPAPRHPPRVVVSGPFRLEVLRTTSKLNHQTGESETELLLEVAWERSVAVVLMDIEPEITIATFDKTPARFSQPVGKILPRGFSQQLACKLTGIPRSAAQLDRLAGQIRFTGSPGWLEFAWSKLDGKTEQVLELDGVQATLQPVRQTERRTEFTIGLIYPEPHPQFESFQQWAVVNTLRLEAVTLGKRAFSIDDDTNLDTAGRRMHGAYSFPRLGKNALQLDSLALWRATYRVPGKLAEYAIPFEFKNLPLP